MHQTADKPSIKIISRLSLYRRLLLRIPAKDSRSVFSHEIAKLAGVSAAQVRRDLMITGYSGSPNRGYQREELIRAIGATIDPEHVQKAAIVGTGHLGKAVLNHFENRKARIEIVAAFDCDPNCCGKEFSNTTCYPIERIPTVIKKLNITVGIIAIPPDSAQSIAKQLVDSGIQGIVNFAPISLDVPESVFVTDIDITTSIETAAYFARIIHE